MKLRGIVTEYNLRNMIILTQDGKFHRQNLKKNQQVRIGDEVKVEKKNIYKKLAASITAAVFMGISAFTGYGMVFAAYGHINIDINPSVELTYNRLLKIIDIKAMNSDGKMIVEELKDVKGKNVREVVKDVVKTAKDKEYLETGKDNNVFITVTEHDNEINEEAMIYDLEKEFTDSIEWTIWEASKEEYDHAQKKKITPAKVILMEKLNNPDLDLENTTVKEMVQEYKALQQTKSFQEKSEKKEEQETKIQDKQERKQEDKKDNPKSIENKMEENKRGNQDQLKGKKEQSNGNDDTIFKGGKKGEKQSSRAQGGEEIKKAEEEDNSKKLIRQEEKVEKKRKKEDSNKKFHPPENYNVETKDETRKKKDPSKENIENRSEKDKPKNIESKVDKAQKDSDEIR